MPARIAARMEQVAAPGAILVTRGDAEPGRGPDALRGPSACVVVKGVPEGLEAHEIVGLPLETRTREEYHPARAVARDVTSFSPLDTVDTLPREGHA